VLKNDIDITVLEVDVVDHVDKLDGRDLPERHTLLGAVRAVEKQEILHSAVQVPFLKKKVRITRNSIPIMLSKSFTICNRHLSVMKPTESVVLLRRNR
jgi:hypothetical protein